ncbi:unnamed protein product [Cunninghamella echinulata]
MKFIVFILTFLIGLSFLNEIDAYYQKCEILDVSECNLQDIENLQIHIDSIPYIQAIIYFKKQKQKLKMIKKVLLMLFLTNVILAQNISLCSEEDIAATGCLGPNDCTYPHPDRCDQFIVCEVNADGVTGRPIIRDCPSGLEWNDNKKVCDWPSESTCSNINPKF